MVAAWSDNARCIQVTGGSAKLDRVTVAGGYGVHIDACDSFVWDGGGNTGKTKKYSLFAGNLLVGRAKFVHLKNLVLPWPSDNEAQLRFMGCDELLIENCTFGSPDHKPWHIKELFQGRHIKKLTAIGSTFYWALMLGALKLGQASAKSLASYHADAKAFRIAATFTDCEILGDVRITGQADARFIKTKFLGPDPRGRSGRTCISLEPFTTAFGKLTPTCTAESCTWFKWPMKAAAGVKIK